jgi:hypothetical protein
MAANNLTGRARPRIIAGWVDADIGRNGAHSVMKQRFARLSSFIEEWYFFENPEELYEFLDDYPKTQMFLVMSGRTAQAIVPARHHFVNIHCMYVFCQQVLNHQRLKDEYDKVKDVMNLEDDLYNLIADDLSFLLIDIGESCVRSEEQSLARRNLEEAMRLMRNLLHFQDNHGRIRRANELLESLV